MNKEEAIDILKNCIADYVIGDFCVGKFCPIEKECKDKECVFEQAIDIVSNYIEELKEKIKVCTDTGAKLIDTKFIKNNYIPKQKLRDKIEELEEMKLDNDDVFGQMKKYVVLVLKEILGEDEK